MPYVDSLELLQSGHSLKQRTPFKGILYERFTDDFGNVILKKEEENTVVVGGAIESLEHLCGVRASWKPKTINELYNIQATPSGVVGSTKIVLFGVGTGGSGLQFGSKVEKDVKSRDIPSFIPLRVSAELTGDDADLYFLKKDNGDGTFSWYGKEFALPPTIKTCWKDNLDDDEDGTEVVDEIAGSSRTENLRTFAEFILDFNTKDVREYYEYMGSLDTALYNSIGLFTGEKVQLEDGSYEYADVRLFAYLNINNKDVSIKTVSQYAYRVLSLT